MAQPITLKQLRYLVAVADARQFGRAAEACHISQPSLSAQIQQLEAVLGTALFERSRRGVLATPAGAALVERARRILAEVDDLVAATHQPGGPLSGRFRLGVIPTLGPYLLPRVLPALRAAYPGLRLYLREEQTARLVERLARGELEAALLALPVEAPGLVERPLFDEPFLLAVPEGHPAAARPTVRESDLAGETVLLLEDGHCLRDQALAVCRQAGVGRQDEFAATSLETLREMVAGGIGVTLLPLLACPDPAGPAGPDGNNRARPGVVVRPFEEPPPSRRIGLAWRRGAARAAEIGLLGDFLEAQSPTVGPEGLRPARATGA